MPLRLQKHHHPRKQLSHIHIALTCTLTEQTLHPKHASSHSHQCIWACVNASLCSCWALRSSICSFSRDLRNSASLARVPQLPPTVPPRSTPSISHERRMHHCWEGHLQDLDHTLPLLATLLLQGLLQRQPLCLLPKGNLWAVALWHGGMGDFSGDIRPIVATELLTQGLLSHKFTSINTENMFTISMWKHLVSEHTCSPKSAKTPSTASHTARQLARRSSARPWKWTGAVFYVQTEHHKGHSYKHTPPIWHRIHWLWPRSTSRKHCWIDKYTVMHILIQHLRYFLNIPHHSTIISFIFAVRQSLPGERWRDSRMTRKREARAQPTSSMVRRRLWLRKDLCWQRQTVDICEDSQDIILSLSVTIQKQVRWQWILNFIFSAHLYW